MVAGCAGWLAGWFVSLWVFLFVDDVGRGDSVLAVSLSLFLWSEKEREIVKASRQVAR